MAPSRACSEPAAHAMTIDRCVELLRELHALDRIAQAIVRGTDPDWQYELIINRNRVFWLRGALSVEDPAVVAAALSVLEAERRAVLPAPMSAAVSSMIH